MADLQGSQSEVITMPRHCCRAIPVVGQIISVDGFAFVVEGITPFQVERATRYSIIARRATRGAAHYSIIFYEWGKFSSAMWIGYWI